MAKKVISIVDDDTELLDILTAFLKNEGFIVRTYSHTTFIDILEKDGFDLLILDAWFDTNLAGVEMAQAIKNRKKLQKKPIIMMSSDSNIQEHASSVGIKNFLSKPLDFETLVATIKAHFMPHSTLQLSPEFATYNQTHERT